MKRQVKLVNKSVSVLECRWFLCQSYQEFFLLNFPLHLALSSICWIRPHDAANISGAKTKTIFSFIRVNTFQNVSLLLFSFCIFCYESYQEMSVQSWMVQFVKVPYTGGKGVCECVIMLYCRDALGFMVILIIILIMLMMTL